MRWTLLPLVALGGCGGSLKYYELPPEDGASDDTPGIDTAHPTTPSDGTTDDGGDADTDTDADVDTDADADADSDADADADTDADADSDADVDTGAVLVPAPPLEGLYEGEITLDYSFKVPLIGFDSTCTGPVTVTIDSLNPYTPVSGALECDWPLLDVKAQLELGHVSGTFTGTIAGTIVGGTTTGGADASSQMDWSEPWSGTTYGTSIVATFSGGQFLYNEYDATIEVEWVGP